MPSINRVRERFLARRNQCKSEWISTNDELPGDGMSGTENMDGEHLLITDGETVTVGYFSWASCEWTCLDHTDIKVTHWMSLPPLPEVDL